MRFFIVALTIGLLTVSASAQGRSGGKRHHARGTQPDAAQQAKNKAAEKAYKAALDKIPNQKYDLWGAVR
jgi:hypothetical protein